MSPEPTSKTAAIRLALTQVENGDDIGVVLSKLYDEGVRVGRQQEKRIRDPFAEDESTPTISAQQKLHPSRRPTVPARLPPPPRLPRGVPYDAGDSSKTTPGSPVPPPPAGRKR